MRERAAVVANGKPKIETSPAVGETNPKIILRVVLFPQPLGPSNPKTCPRGISKDTLSTARSFSPRNPIRKSLVSPLTAIAGPVFIF